MPNNELIKSATIVEVETASLLEKLQATSKMLIERSRIEIDSVKTLIEFQENPVLYFNSILLLQGQKGSHKSRVLELIISSLYNNQKPNSAGFCAKINDFKVILVDTERSKLQFLPKAIQRIKKAAGFPIEYDLPSFYPYSVIDVARESRLQAIQEIIEYHRRDYLGHLIVAVDVTSDLLMNFNDVSESMNLTDYLNDLVNANDCAFMMVLHENPGSTSNKSRGHLGSELTNKSATVIQTENKGVVNIKYLHIRESRNPGTFHLKYDDAINSLVPISKEEATELEVNEIVLFEQESRELLKNGTRVTAGEFYNTMKNLIGISTNTCKKYINIINKKNADDNESIISSIKIGRSNYYFIENKQLKAI